MKHLYYILFVLLVGCGSDGGGSDPQSQVTPASDPEPTPGLEPVFDPGPITPVPDPEPTPGLEPVFDPGPITPVPDPEPTPGLEPVFDPGPITPVPDPEPTPGLEPVFDPGPITPLTDPDQVRADLLTFIFGTAALPSHLPDRVEVIGTIDKLTINTTNGYTSFVYYMRPTVSNGKLMIYHQGHGGDALVVGRPAIDQLLDNGYTVLALTMPGIGSNVGDPDHNTNDTLVPFLEPVAVALNYAELQQSFDAIGMMGLSGGGWTTVVYAALDKRIEGSYPVAGSVPEYIRHLPTNGGDFEQYYLDYYAIAGYLAHYVLGAQGGKQIALYNYQDPCCFPGEYAYDWQSAVDAKAAEFGGNYDVVIDYDNTTHSISVYHMSVILADMGTL